MSIEEIYKQKCAKKCDINEHLPTLKKYASNVNHVTEFGVRRGVSTAAFLAGKPKVLRSYDVNKKRFESYGLYKKVAKDTDFLFIKANVLKIKINPTDLLFIDTRHTYDQLKRELSLHANKVRQYIIFHDTVTFGMKGGDGKSPGLLLAIEKFLQKNKKWKIDKIYKNNNGLYVIRNDGKI